MIRVVKLFIIGFISILFTSTFAQTSVLQSGPMTTYATMREVKLWVQTKQSAQVYIQYWQKEVPTKKFKTETILTEKDNAFIAHLLAAPLEPSHAYQYEVYINQKLVQLPYSLEFETTPLWKWRGDAPNFSFATGSCAYINESDYDRPGTPYGSNYQIFEAIHHSNPNFMLWLGDNVYLREADWDSKTGIQHRFTQAHSLPELQALWGSTHHYFIWDDHDYGSNNSDRSFPMKKTTQTVFRDFFPNPNYIFEQGNVSFFQWADCDFFLLDNRTWRTPDLRTDIDNPTILGNEQLEWLIDGLANSMASFKFVVMGGQFINPMKVEETYENIAPMERAYIIEKIKKLKINGVVFFSGDVHHTELSQYDLTATYPLYDLTVSPFTSGISMKDAELNPLQVAGTLVSVHNFAKLEIYGPLKDRKLKINIMGSDGHLIWQKEIASNDLKFN